MSDNLPDDPDIVTTNGILLCCVTGAVAKAELIGVPLDDDDLDLLNS